MLNMRYKYVPINKGYQNMCVTMLETCYDARKYVMLETKIYFI